MSRVSVVVITRDRREQLLTSLAHLVALPEQPPIIVVDNGSGDGTAVAVRAAFPGVTVLEPGRNLGSVGRTLGVRAATTPYVAFSDDDSWWAPGSLARAVEYFDATPRLAVLAARPLVGDEDRLDPLCPLMDASPLRAPDLPGVAVLGFLACAAVVRTRAYLQVGGFSEIVFFLGEEALLAMDLVAAGWGLAHVDDVVAHHHPAPGPERADRARLQRRNDLLTTWLRRPPALAARRTIALARASPGAVLDALSRGPAVLAGRHRLPAHVESQLRQLEAP